MTTENFEQQREDRIELAQTDGPSIRSEAYTSPGQQVVDWVNSLIPDRISQQNAESQSGNNGPGNTGPESPATRFNNLIANLEPDDAVGRFAQFINSGFRSANGNLQRQDQNEKANNEGTNLKPGDILREISNGLDPKLAVYTGRRSDGTPMVTTITQDSAGKNVVANIPYSDWLKTVKDAGLPNPEIKRPIRENTQDARIRSNQRVVTGYSLPRLEIG